VVDALKGIPEVGAGDWAVLPTPTDAVAPPCFVIQWGPDPWRLAFSACADTAQLQVVCIAGRLTPEGAYPLLERMVDSAVAYLGAARLRPAQVLQPGPLEVGNITYLASRVQLARPVSTEVIDVIPPVLAADWAWGDITPQQVAASTFVTTGTPRAIGMNITTAPDAGIVTTGTIEGVGFYRYGGDPTVSRRIGVYIWHGHQGVAESRITETVDEPLTGEGWVRAPIDPPIRVFSDVGSEAEHFVPMVEVPDGSGFYTSPQVAVPSAPNPRLSFAQPIGTSTLPAPNTFPFAPAPGVPGTARVWVDVLFRPGP